MKHYHAAIAVVAVCLCLSGQGYTDTSPDAPVLTPEAMTAMYAEARQYYEANQYKESFKRFRVLAVRGFPQAKMSIAYQYEKGLGVMPNRRKAYEWYLSAADDGLPAALIAIGIKYREGDLVQRNSVLSYALFLAANKIHPGQVTRGLAQAVSETLDAEQKALGERLAKRMVSGRGAISRTIRESEKIGTPVL